MARPKNQIPTYKLHKSTGLARCWAGGRWVSLGKYGSPESRTEFARIVAELASAPVADLVLPEVGSELTVDQLLLAFLQHAHVHYRRADGTITDQVAEYKYAAKPLHALYGHTPAKDFGPLALKTVRKAFVDAGNARTVVNSRAAKIKRVFKWAASEQLVPVTTYTALATVEGLQEGRSAARESEPVEPVDPEHVAKTLPYLNRHVAGLVLFQQLTGCRPGEASAVRRCDIDTSADVWIYRPPQHKTRHKKKARPIPLGSGAQTLLGQFFTDDPTAYLFSPVRAVEEFRASRAANRKTPNYPSHTRRNEQKRAADPKRKPSRRYTRQAYHTAVVRACDRAKIPHWHPNQLRHLFATEVRKAHGLEAAQVLLGHARADVTQIYAEKNLALAVQVAAAVG